MRDELAALARLGEPLPVAGEVVEILPLTVLRAARVARALEPALAAGLDWAGGPEALAVALARHGDALIGAVAAACDREPAWVGDLALDEFIGLAGALVRVNADFFGQRVRPAWTRALESATAGPTPSPP